MGAIRLCGVNRPLGIAGKVELMSVSNSFTSSPESVSRGKRFLQQLARYAATG